MPGRGHDPPAAREAAHMRHELELPRATLQFRLKSWRAFQRALDPLAAPKPLRPPRQQR